MRKVAALLLLSLAAGSVASANSVLGIAHATGTGAWVEVCVPHDGGKTACGAATPNGAGTASFAFDGASGDCTGHLDLEDAYAGVCVTFGQDPVTGLPTVALSHANPGGQDVTASGKGVDACSTAHATVYAVTGSAQPFTAPFDTAAEVFALVVTATSPGC
jgi:hypothetical protein